jgi:hypothetical protein
MCNNFIFKPYSSKKSIKSFANAYLMVLKTLNKLKITYLSIKSQNNYNKGKNIMNSSTLGHPKIKTKSRKNTTLRGKAKHMFAWFSPLSRQNIMQKKLHVGN